MREPQLESFMAELEAKDFSLVQLLVYGNIRNPQSEDLAYEKIIETYIKHYFRCFDYGVLRKE